MYKPPLEDIRDVLENVIGVEALLKQAAFPELDQETIWQVLQSGADFVAAEVSPHAAELDAEGCSFVNGRVRVPRRFQDIWRAYVEGGWVALSMASDYGGHGIPVVAQAAFSEMVCGASVAVSMLPLLMRGAAEVLARKAAPDVRDQYLAKLVEGRWGATIAMTEPDAGSDIGLARARAEARDDGSWSITGTKMFISFGDQDLTEGIVHIVLARTGGKGPGGLSLFAVPVDHALPRDGSVVPVRIEHKLGLHASPTCVMSFNEARGYLLGELNEGLKTIFIMVNGMRLEVAGHGVGVASAATQAAIAYAAERLQGQHKGKTVALIEHPDVRRNLLTMKSMTDGARTLVYETARLLDLSRHGIDSKQRKKAADRVALLLPICKAGCSDLAVLASSLAIQVHGGHGYIRDVGVERLYRDARIFPIYEGANGIQAIDLLLRKHVPNDGAVMAEWLQEMRDEIAQCDQSRISASALSAMRTAIDDCAALAQSMLQKARADQDGALAAATPFLQIVFYVAVGWSLLRNVQHGKLTPEMRRVLAEFYIEQILPQTKALELMAAGSSAAWTGMPSDLFA